MKRISKVERQQKILDLLTKEGTVEVSSLAQDFQCSEMSIRNDLNILNTQGKLQRIHGGAQSISVTGLELPLTERQKSHMREKELIGKVASNFVKNGDSLLIDAGTTTEYFAKYLSDFLGLTVITNGINILSILMRYPSITLYTVEGRVDHRSFSIVGQEAEHTLLKYYAKLSFISVDGLTLEHGLMNESFEATNITRIILQNSQKKILLADSSKIGKLGVSKLASYTMVDTLITDRNIPADYLRALTDAGVEVIIAEEYLS